MKDLFLEIQNCLTIHDRLNFDLVFQDFNVDLNNGLSSFVTLNHQCNIIIWKEEDLARRSDVDPLSIVANKRTIDKYNQIRNDAIEMIDQEILVAFKDVELKKNASQNSETIGSIIDRLSILNLKIRATKINMNSSDDSLVKLCIDRIQVLNLQLDDLKKCLFFLIEHCSSGKKYIKVYRQYKMYNDSRFNKNITKKTKLYLL